MRHHRKLTDDERHQIIQARAEGTPAATLAHRFGVSRRTIYNTLNLAKSYEPTASRTGTVTTRVSDRDLTAFMAALDKRGITDRHAALRRLINAADKILMVPDRAVIAAISAWKSEIQNRGAEINRVARKLNEAKLLRQPIFYTSEDDAVIREFMAFIVTFAHNLNDAWSAELEAMSHEVEKALAR